MGGNSETQAKAATVWDFEAEAILLNVRADTVLNQYDGLSHTLVLNVVQTAEAQPFQALAKGPAALLKAMESGNGPGVLGLERFYIEPGTTRQIVLDRMEKAKYVGIIAAYYGSEPARNARLFRIGVDVKTEGLVVKTRTSKPAPIAVNVRLGPSQILQAVAPEKYNPELPPESPQPVPVTNLIWGPEADLLDPARSKGVEILPPVEKGR